MTPAASDDEASGVDAWSHVLVDFVFAGLLWRADLLDDAGLLQLLSDAFDATTAVELAILLGRCRQRQPTAPDLPAAASSTTTSAAVRPASDGHLVLVATGEFDVATADILAGALNQVESSQSDVEVDARAASFLDVFTTRLLRATHDTLSRSGRRLTVTGAPPVVRRVLSVTGLAELLA